MAKSDALKTEHLFEHVQDAPFFHFPRSFAPETNGHIFLPQPLATPKTDASGDVVMNHHTHTPEYEVAWQPATGMPVLDRSLKPLDFVFTKFMLLELVVAVLLVVVFGLLATRIKSGRAVKGKVANFLETLLVFIRDDVARPAIGKQEADAFLPFLWTIFFFVLGCNLLGMLPWLGTATGALGTTAALAFITFVVVILAGSKKLGFVGFLKAQVPHMELPKPLGYFLVPLIFAIEIVGLFIKHIVLAFRLLANMLAGHLVLAVFMAFISTTYGLIAWWGVAPASVLGAVAFSLLELFVAFLQAYVFTLLSALFIGAAVHPH